MMIMMMNDDDNDGDDDGDQMTPVMRWFTHSFVRWFSISVSLLGLGWSVFVHSLLVCCR